jgi:hypothetical protein
VSVVCCQVEVPALGRSLVQRSPTECGVSKCGREAPIMRRPWPTGGLLRRREKVKLNQHVFKHDVHRMDVVYWIADFTSDSCREGMDGESK